MQILERPSHRLNRTQVHPIRARHLPGIAFMRQLDLIQIRQAARRIVDLVARNRHASNRRYRRTGDSRVHPIGEAAPRDRHPSSRRRCASVPARARIDSPACPSTGLPRMKSASTSLCASRSVTRLPRPVSPRLLIQRIDHPELRLVLHRIGVHDILLQIDQRGRGLDQPVADLDRVVVVGSDHPVALLRTRTFSGRAVAVDFVVVHHLDRLRRLRIR